MKSLGAQVREFREARGWNTTQMADAIRATRMPGTDKTSRQNIEGLEAAGNRYPKYIAALARVMGKSVDDMLAQAGLAGRGARTDSKAEAAPQISQDEAKLLDAFRGLDPAVQAAVLRAAGLPQPGGHDAERVLRANICQSGPRKRQLKKGNP
jgi:transcriptional regulator with XRE-family HTH domain